MRSLRIGVLAALLLLQLVSTQADRAEAAPPNLLVIVTDDQRAGSFSMMPAVRRWLVRGGTIFPNAVATTPLCCPSRASILTGLLAHNHGILRNEVGAQALTDVEDLMVQHALHADGYRTALFGKYLNGWPLETDPSGWDRWAVSERATYEGAEWNVDGSVQVVDRNSTPFLGGAVRSFVRDAEQEDDPAPWFAYVGFSAPHRPSTVPDRYADVSVPSLVRDPAMNERDVHDKPWWVRRHRHLVPTSTIEETRIPMLRSLVPLDDQIDRLMELLEGLDELDDTLVILLSDNGFLWGEHHMMKKAVPYLPAIRVPFVVRWPTHVPVGTDERPVATIDVAPTLLGAAGVSAPREMDGINLLGPATRSAVPIEFWRADESAWRGLVARRWVFVEYLRSDGRIRAREYYRLPRDPYQLSNVFRDGVAGNEPNAERLSARSERASTCQGADCVL